MTTTLATTLATTLTTTLTTTPATTRPRALTARQFHELADVPPEVEWFANIANARTRRAYRIDLRDFMSFTSIARPAGLCAEAAQETPLES